MLKLYRMKYFNEFKKDSIDGRIIGPGEYYYFDTNPNGKQIYISAEHYWELKKQKMEDEWDDSYINQMESERDYRERLREQEREYLEGTILNMTRLEDLR